MRIVQNEDCAKAVSFLTATGQMSNEWAYIFKYVWHGLCTV